MRFDGSPQLMAGSPILNEFNGTILDILDRVTYSRVMPNEVDDAVYKLRYDAYRREESVPFNDAGTVIDDLDNEPNVMIFGIHIDGRLVSSIRVHHLHSGHRASPSMKVMPDVLGPMLDRGESFIDPSRFTADQEASLAYPALPFLTLRIATMASVHFNVGWCLALVRPEHGAFYRRIFRSKELGDTRSYPGLAFPVKLFGAKVADCMATTFQRYPFFLSTDAEREALFGERPARATPTTRQAIARAVDFFNAASVAAG